MLSIKPAVEGPSVDPQDCCCLSLIASGNFKNPFYIILFNLQQGGKTFILVSIENIIFEKIPK